MENLTANQHTQMLLSVQMIIDHLEDVSWSFQANVQGDSAVLSTCRFYADNEPLCKRTLYLVDESHTSVFPADSYCYVAAGDLNGAAPHISGIHRPITEIANCVLRVFQKFQEFEASLNFLVQNGGSLTELCRAGEKFFRNPIFIHDNLFSLIGLPRDVETSGRFQYNPETGHYHIPISIIDEFKYEEAYLKSFQHHQASVWDSNLSPNGFRSLYVNLWEGAHYYGRLMINERETSLKPGQFKAADYLAEYAILIIRRDSMAMNQNYQGFEDTFISLALGREVSAFALNTVLHVLDWKAEDRYICLRLQSKTSSLAVNPVSAVRSLIATELSSYSSFFYEQQLCVIINLTRSGLTPPEVQQRLAPQIRDNYMCGGLSNPFTGLSMLPAAFRQAEAALLYTTEPRTESWFVSFEKCALDYIEKLALQSLPPELLAAPQLLKLKSLDEEKGTDYYETLKAWLVNERNIPKTSEALIVHRTTLTYRLKKLREMIPMDLNDDATRLYLLFSYHLLEENGN